MKNCVLVIPYFRVIVLYVAVPPTTPAAATVPAIVMVHADTGN